MNNEQALEEKYQSYPKVAAIALNELRQLIKRVAKEMDIKDLNESLKWGEPSFISKQGSTIRIDWKARAPDEYAIYFNCKTTLIETYKELYPQVFTYGGNRSIFFRLGEEVPEPALKHCITLALNYHNVKHLPLLGG